jgi:hypothetical protein
MMNRFEKEADQRTGSYRKTTEDEVLLKELNLVLEGFEDRFLSRDREHHERKQFFVVGAPRSGTTLLTQFLVNAFELGYISNAAARFFKAPISGLWLERQIYGVRDSRVSLKSDFARTKGWSGIHEFGYFWREYLNISSPTDILDKIRMTKDFEQLFKHLDAIGDFLGANMVYKNIYGSYVAQEMMDYSPNNFWFYIERDIVDACCSIVDARLKHFGRVDAWWSYHPLEFSEIENIEPYRQIFLQVNYLQSYYRRLALDNPDRFFTVKYGDLGKPLRVKEVFNALAEKTGEKLNGEGLRFNVDNYNPRLKHEPELKHVFSEMLKNER